LLAYTFFAELDARYGNDNWGYAEQIKHFGMLMQHMMKLPAQQKLEACSHYFNYSHKLCSNWEHFQSRQAPAQQQITDRCRNAHN
jgi:hypothetical protein